MKLFFDTSSLFKLYHLEQGSEALLEFLSSKEIDSICISELTIIEFCSAVWKKCRKNEITEEIAKLLIGNFESDLIKYQIVAQTTKVTIAAKNLIYKYWKSGLRTLDSIQLASVLSVEKVDLFFTSDLILGKIAKEEHLKIFVS